MKREMFKECTFKPQIKKLPVHYGPPKDDSASFLDRVSKWQKEKEADANRRKQFMDYAESQDCTFKPKINASSIKAVMEIRGGEINENANERLYKANEVASANRMKLIEEELRRERLEESIECTFKPRTNSDKFKVSRKKEKKMTS